MEQQSKLRARRRGRAEAKATPFERTTNYSQLEIRFLP